MASGSQNMTTYVAKQVIGSNVAQNPAGALLQSGANRADDSTTGDTWLFLDTVGGTANPWGIMHSQGDNKIKIFGSGTEGAWVRMNTGDTYLLGKVGIGYDPETSENTYKLYVNGTGFFTGDVTIAHSIGDATLTATSTNPRLTFSENGTQPVSIAYTDWDSYRSPAGLKIIGGTNASPAWLEVEGNIHGAQLHLRPAATSYGEGIRIHMASNNWCTIALCGTDNTGDTGTSANTWSIHNNAGNFYISRNNSSGGCGLRCVSDMWSIANKSTASAAYSNAAIQIREYNHGGAQTDNWQTAPRLGFHWSNRNAAQIGLASNGNLYECPGTGTTFYKLVYETGTWGINISGGAAYASSYLASRGSVSGSTHAAALQAYFNSNKASEPRNALVAHYSSAYSNGSLCMGYFLSGYDSNPYGGFFVAHYNQCYYVGISNGTYTQYKIWRQGESITSAVWNDYAEYRISTCTEPGYCVFENGDDTLSKTTKRLQHFAGIISDTWGFAQGETKQAKTPIAVSGRVLAYTYRNRNEYKPGDCVCAAPNGTVDIMSQEEIRLYPDKIVGMVSCVPDYEEWGGEKDANRDPVKVNGRIWIKVK